MAEKTDIKTFLVDCHYCRARVAAIETGRASDAGNEDYTGEPYAIKLIVGKCPSCNNLIAGETHQVEFGGFGFGEEDIWSDVKRIYPDPPKTLINFYIPSKVKKTISEADKCLQVNANKAACAMYGCALEAVCRDLLEPKPKKRAKLKKEYENIPSKPIMLGDGIKQLKEKGFIDDRLFDWSQHLQSIRNYAAHPTEIDISKKDAEDMQIFVYTIVEYIYDLFKRYNEFKERIAEKSKQKK